MKNWTKPIKRSDTVIIFQTPYNGTEKTSISCFPFLAPDRSIPIKLSSDVSAGVKQFSTLPSKRENDTRLVDFSMGGGQQLSTTTSCLHTSSINQEAEAANEVSGSRVAKRPISRGGLLEVGDHFCALHLFKGTNLFSTVLESRIRSNRCKLA